jgi:HPt (histidine-containing phosphotransfer) domain-containing protein
MEVLLAGRLRFPLFNFMSDLDDDFPDIDVSDVVIPGVDAELGNSLCGGELDMFVAALKSFASNVPDALEKLSNVSAETLSRYATAVHGLKGTCACIGAEELRKKAYDLEMKSKAGDLNGILAHNESFLKEMEKLVKDIKTWLNKYF